MSLFVGRRVFMARGEGVVRETANGQTGKGRVCMGEGEVFGGPPHVREFGKNVS